MEIELKRRLGGKEDLQFDLNGTGATTSFEYGGETHVLHSINAGHVPTLASTRQAITGGTASAADVDSALLALNTKIVDAGDFLSVDTDVVLEVTATLETLQAVIDSQPRNLGKHTLRFLVPSAGIALQQDQTMDFRGFYNGTLVLTSATDTPAKITYTDVDSYVRLLNCSCAVEVTNVDITYCSSAGSLSGKYGIYAEGSPYVSISSVAFEGKVYQEASGGIAAYDCYPAYVKGGDCGFSSCTLTIAGSTVTADVYAGFGGEGGTKVEDLDETVGGLNVTVGVLNDRVDEVESQVTGAVDKNYMVCWGKNTNGEFGAGKKTNLTKQFLGYPLNCSDACFDSSNGISIFNNKLYTTGVNTYGQLGLSCNSQSGWMQQNDFGDWSDCEVCNGSCAAIRKKTLYTWGRNNWGQLGDESTENTSLPKQVLTRVTVGTDPASFTDDWREVEVGPGHMLAYAHSTASGRSTYGVYSCGRNRKGQLGQQNVYGSFYCLSVISAFENAPTISLSAGGRLVDGEELGISACIYQDNAALETGKLYTWGYGTDGALGIGASPAAVNATPSLISRVINDGVIETLGSEGGVWLKVSCGARHISALRKTTDSQSTEMKTAVYTAGYKYALGKGGESDPNAYLFTRISFDDGVLDEDEYIVDVKSGYDVTFLLSNKGRVYGYGKNVNYSLALKAGSSTTYYPTPRLIGSGANAIRSGCLCYGGCFISTNVQKDRGQVQDYAIAVSGITVDANANGTYNPPAGSTATGTSRTWSKSGGYVLSYDTNNNRWRIISLESDKAVQATGYGEPTEGTWTDTAATPQPVTVKVYEEA